MCPLPRGAQRLQSRRTSVAHTRSAVPLARSRGAAPIGWCELDAWPCLPRLHCAVHLTLGDGGGAALTRGTRTQETPSLAEAVERGDVAAVGEVEVGVDARVDHIVAVARVADVAAEDEDLSLGDAVALVVDG